MNSIKILKVGNSLGAAFPQELMDDLNIQEGDELCLVRTKKGFELMLYEPDFSAEMSAYSHATQRHRNALGQLSK